MSRFHSLIVGEIAQDTNVDYDGTTVQAVGGAVYYSGFAAANMGHKTAVLPKADTARVDLKAAFAPAPNVTVFPLHSTHSFVTKNVYHTPDRERRTSTVDSKIDPYRPEEVPAEIDAEIWHLAGLVGGDILTGLTDRAEAAKVLYGWGAKEILITHNTEVLVYDGKEIYTCPIKARSLGGRTGRGDTTFACYINERLTQGIPAALQTATALVSLKMETPGPYMGTGADVEDYIRKFY